MGTKPLAKKILVALSLCKLGLAGSAQAATNQAGDEVSFTEEEWEANVHWRHKTSGYGISFAVEEGAVTEVSVKAADGTLIVDSNGVKVNTGGIESEASTSLVTGQTVYNYLHQESVAIGKGSYVEVDPGIAIGRSALVTAENCVAIGYEAVAIDSRTKAEQTAESAEGATTRTQTVSFGHGASDKDADNVVFGTTVLSRLINVADGVSDTDAATVGQMNSAFNTKIGKVADGTYQAISASNTISENLIALDKALGEGSSGTDVSNLKTITRADSAEATGTDAIALGSDAKAAGENAIAFGTGSVVTGTDSIAVGMGHQISGNNSGAFGDPSYIDADNSYAIGNNNKISGEKTFVLGNDVETSAKRAVVLGDGSTATEDNVVSVGSKDNPRKIVNVAKGENDTDAVNVAQLKETVSGTVAGVNQALSDLDSRVNKVGAGAAALAALHPGTYNPEDKMSFAVGYGHYKNANAGAFGAFFRPNEDVTVSVGSTFGNGNPMMNAGVSFKLGQRGKRLAPSDAGAVQRLMMENASQAKQIEALAHDNAKLKADNEKMQAQIAMILEKMQLSEMVEKSAR